MRVLPQKTVDLSTESLKVLRRNLEKAVYIELLQPETQYNEETMFANIFSLRGRKGATHAKDSLNYLGSAREANSAIEDIVLLN